MSKPHLFLETTIQIERVVGPYARQLALRNELGKYQLVTSAYVLGEYLRTIVNDAILLHRIFTQEHNLADVLTAIGVYPNKRTSSRMNLILADVLRAEQAGEQNLKQSIQITFLDRLSSNIEFALTNRFMRGIEEVIDQCQCGLAQECPVVNQSIPGTEPPYTLRSQCLRRVRECDLAERMTEWQPELNELSKGLANETDPALKRIRQLIQEIMVDPVRARGRNCTWYLGDLVIALELPPDTPLLHHECPTL